MTDDESYAVDYAEELEKEFRKLGHTAAADIIDAVDKKLTVDPDGYGEPLSDDLTGYLRLRVGQWRVVYWLDEDEMLVLVLAVGKRAEGDRENIYDNLSGTKLDKRRNKLKNKVKKEKSSK